MFADIPLRELADLQAPERAFVSVYLSSPNAISELDARIATAQHLLGDHPEEREHFTQNLTLLRKHLDRHPPNGPQVLFVCWALAHLSSYPLPKGAQILGNIKNHVRKGGWSQQRYQRRRDKQLQQYAKQIADALLELDTTSVFRRILMVGSRETLAEIERVLPAQLQHKDVTTQALDLSKGDAFVGRELAKLMRDAERLSETHLWEQIRAQFFHGGLAVFGPAPVLDALRIGRVDQLILTRDHHATATRCRDCDHLYPEPASSCHACSSQDVYTVDLVNELTELAIQTRASTDFVDPIPELTAVGDVAALLRY